MVHVGSCLKPLTNISYRPDDCWCIEIVEDFPRSVTKREVERAKLKAYSNDRAWDREKVMGRMSGQARS